MLLDFAAVPGYAQTIAQPFCKAAAMRNYIFGGIGILWGLLILGARLISFLTEPAQPQSTNSAYSAGSTLGLIFGFLMLVAGGIAVAREVMYTMDRSRDESFGRVGPRRRKRRKKPATRRDPGYDVVDDWDRKRPRTGAAVPGPPAKQLDVEDWEKELLYRGKKSPPSNDQLVPIIIACVVVGLVLIGCLGGGSWLAIAKFGSRNAATAETPAQLLEPPGKRLRQQLESRQQQPASAAAPQEKPSGPVGEPASNSPNPPAATNIFASGPRVFLSDLQEFGAESGPWPVTKAGLGNPDKSPIRVKGRLSPKGIGMHPPSGPGTASVSYRLGRQAAIFKATVAIDDSTDWCFTPAIFSVVGDGKELFKSGNIAHNHARTQECSVDVSGVDVLELRVTAIGHNHGVHAVWVEPRLLQRADTPDR